MLIDAHHHLWRISRGDYGWLRPEAGSLYRDFEPEAFEPLIEREGITRTVLVQAAPSVDETRFLLSLADRCAFIGGVVGWVDFADPLAPEALAGLATHPRFRGARPMIQDIADERWMLRPGLRDSFRSIVDLGLRFDALVHPRHLAHLIELSARHPDLRIAVDHGAKPDVHAWTPGDANFAAWAAHLRALAGNPNVFCKLSGLPSCAAPGWRRETFAPYVDVLRDAFGPRRLMWGSDWPVLGDGADYRRWREVAASLVAPADRAAVFGDTARDFYSIEPPDRPAENAAPT